MAAIEIAGMAVAFPVGIGLALIIGVITNYLATPVGNVTLLAVGVALVTLAIVLDAVAYRRLAASAASVSTKGLILAIACGILMGSFYRFVAAAMYADQALPEPGKMGPYVGRVRLRDRHIPQQLCVEHVRNEKTVCRRTAGGLRRLLQG